MAHANGSPTVRAIAQRDHGTWLVRVENPNGRFVGGTQARGLDLVESKVRQLVLDHTGEVNDEVAVEVEVRLPAATEQRLELCERLYDEITIELNEVVRELVADGWSPVDIRRLFQRRALKPNPTPLVVTNAEVLAHGLANHPDVVGLRWSDNGFAVTMRCRGCVEASRIEYLENPDDENELVYGTIECDFCDVGSEDIGM